MRNGLIVVASLLASFSLIGRDPQSTFTVRDIQLITETRGLDLGSYRESLMLTLKSEPGKSLLRKPGSADVRVVFQATISRNGKVTKLIVVSQSGSGTRTLIKEAAATLGSVTFQPLPDDLPGDKLSALFIVTNER